MAGARTQDPLLKREMLYQLSYQVKKIRKNKCDLAGARTQDPLLKREMLYQLSYQVKIIVPRTGVEPARPKVIRPSSVHVYQFRHLGKKRTILLRQKRCKYKGIILEDKAYFTILFFEFLAPCNPLLFNYWGTLKNSIFIK